MGTWSIGDGTIEYSNHGIEARAGKYMEEIGDNACQKYHGCSQYVQCDSTATEGGEEAWSYLYADRIDE